MTPLNAGGNPYINKEWLTGWSASKNLNPGATTNLHDSITYINLFQFSLTNTTPQTKIIQFEQLHRKASSINTISAKMSTRNSNRKGGRVQPCQTKPLLSDSGAHATGTFKPSCHQINIQHATCLTAKTSSKALIPTTTLNEQAHNLGNLLKLNKTSLVLVYKLYVAGYTTMFHTGGGQVTVYWHGNISIQTKEKVRKGWKETWIMESANKRNR